MFNMFTDGISYPSEFLETSDGLELQHKIKVLHKRDQVFAYGGVFTNSDDITNKVTCLEEVMSGHTMKLFRSGSDIQFNCNVTNGLGTYTQKFLPTKYYTSLFPNIHVDHADLSKLDLDVIPLPLATSYNSFNNETQVYFNIESSQQLRDISDHYGLVEPLTQNMNNIIDKHRFAVRWKSVQLPDKSYVSIVLGSIVYDSSYIPIDIRVYFVYRLQHSKLVEAITTSNISMAKVDDKGKYTTRTIGYMYSDVLPILLKSFPNIVLEKYMDCEISDDNIFNQTIATMVETSVTGIAQFQADMSYRTLLLEDKKIVDKLHFNFDNPNKLYTDQLNIASDIINTLVGNDVTITKSSVYFDPSKLELYEPTKNIIQVYFRCNDLSKFKLKDVLDLGSDFISCIVDVEKKEIVKSILYYTYSHLYR